MSLKSKKNILYIGGFGFDKSNAASVRVIENARFLQSLNYNVKILGKITLKENESFKIIKGVKVFDIENTGTSYATDITTIILYIENSVKKVDFIIAYNYPPIVFAKLIKYCEINNIVLIPDLTEWYGIDGKFTLMKGIRLALNEWRMYVLNKKCDNVIVASTFLENMYKKSNNLILPFVTVDELSLEKSISIDKNNLIFVYAGSPGMNFSKDRIDIIIKAFANIKTIHSNFILRIVGLLKEDLLKEKRIKNDVTRLEENIECYGRVKNEECIQIIKDSNFVIFARDIKRGNSAGYPTKVFEAFKYGLPVITNKTSDIELHVNSSNGFLVEKATVSEFVNCLNKILSSKTDELNKVINNCRLDNPFSSKYYKDKTEQFFKNII